MLPKTGLDQISTEIESSALPVSGSLRSLVRLLQTFPLPSERAMKTSPGTRFAGTRNILAHGYLQIDLDILWDIVEIDIPRLIERLERERGK